MKNYLIICILFLIAVNTIKAELELIKFDKEEYPEAVCLDGSMAGFYWEEGTGDGADKYILYFEGGGVCLGTTPEEVLRSCYIRTFNAFGSSIFWKKTKKTNSIVNNDKEKNPQFYNWNKIYIPYCGGAVHQGYQKEPFEYNGKKIYVRGLKGTQATFDYALNKLGMKESSTTEVLLTGSSAGGLGAFYFGDVLGEQLHPNTRYWVAPDSGFFINYHFNDPTTFMSLLMNSLLELANKEEIYPQNCPYLYDKEQAYKCVLPSEFAQNIKSDLYIIMSQYDPFNVMVFQGVECVKHRSFQNCSPEQVQELNNFRNLMNAEVENILAQKSNANAWLIACSQHCFLINDQTLVEDVFEVPIHTGFRAVDSMIEWMYSTESQRFNRIDDVEWPLNLPCNGYEINGDLSEEYEQIMKEYEEYLEREKLY